MFFFKVWQDIDKYDPSRGSFTGWIGMIAKFTALDFRRKTMRRWQIMRRFLERITLERREELQGQPLALSLEGLDQEMLLKRVGEAIKELPEDKQELVALRFGWDNTYAEIAELTGRPVGSVKSALSRTLSHLREVVSEQPTPDSGLT